MSSEEKYSHRHEKTSSGQQTRFTETGEQTSTLLKFGLAAAAEMAFLYAVSEDEPV